MDGSERENWTYRSDKRVVLLEKIINQGDMEPASPKLCVSHNTSGFYTVKRCIQWKKIEKMRKGDRKRKRTFFKAGNQFSPNNRCHDSQSKAKDNDCVKYSRPTAEEADLVDQDPIEPFALQPEVDSDNAGPSYKLLRSRKPTSTDVCKGKPDTMELR